jgi:hypothetical protein
MSLKSVEMQIAIPRTNEAGMVQNQLSHKPMHDQAALASGTVQQAQQLRQKAAKVDESVSKRIKDGSGEQRGKQPKAHAGSKSVKKQADEAHGHPYKGHHIDFSL